ncbi:MAG TPA: MFS transporter [Candidatus Bathyarchaeia archaeon]|nr:MFS transporter [Candidatus Bathyarchaeia archaeon]
MESGKTLTENIEAQKLVTQLDTSQSIVQRSIFSVLFLTVFLDFLGFSIVLPYIFFYAKSLGATPLVYGLLLTSYSLMQFIFTPILGSLSDRHGRRRILLLSLSGTGISLLVFGLANSLWLLFVARIVAGSLGAAFPVANAYIADITSKETRLKYMGMMGAAFGLGFIIGPAIGGTLSSLYGYAVPSFIAAALAFSNLALGYFRLPEPPKRNLETRPSLKETVRTIATRTDLKLLFVTYLVALIAFNVSISTATPWLQQVASFGPFQVGLLFFLVGIVLAISQGVAIPRLSKKFQPEQLFLIGIIATAASFALFFTTAYSLLVLLGSLTILAFGSGIIFATASAIVSLRVSAQQQGGALGMTQSAQSISEIIGPTLGNSLFGYGATFGIYSLSFMASTVMIIPAIGMSLRLSKAIAASN